MKILGIETSCDDTSVALIERVDDRFVTRAHVTASQVDIHAKYGGIIPEVAGREHAAAIIPVLDEALGDERPDVIAVTAGPGLITSLVVGVEIARGLSNAWNVPVVRTNHIEGHIHSILLGDSAPQTIPFPAVALVVSGGHTELILMRGHGDYELIGKTRDDAAGECFDKVGKLLGFKYPGGPKISKAATNGKRDAIELPRPMLKSDDFDFSFAGLKTAARYYLRDNDVSSEEDVADFCASFEQAIVDVLVAKTIKAAKQYGAKSILLSGGVSANRLLRDSLLQAAQDTDAEMIIPEMAYTTDNAAMIAAAAYFHATKNQFTDWQELVADPAWELIR